MNHLNKDPYTICSKCNVASQGKQCPSCNLYFFFSERKRLEDIGLQVERQLQIYKSNYDSIINKMKMPFEQRKYEYQQYLSLTQGFFHNNIENEEVFQYEQWLLNQAKQNLDKEKQYHLDIISQFKML